MTTDTENQENQIPDELTTLKARATAAGLQFHPSIGVDTLREKLRAYLSDEPAQPEVKVSTMPDLSKVDMSTGFAVVSKEESKSAKQYRIRQEANKLVRIVVHCNNPSKRDWEGEYFAVGNNLVGDMKKYVPFDNEEGWHVPQFIVNAIKDRQCQIFVNAKNEKGEKFRKAKLIQEFTVVTLPELDDNELKELAQRQAMANGTASAIQ